MRIRHKFQSATANQGDTSMVRPSNWNDDHDVEIELDVITATPYTFTDDDRGRVKAFNAVIPIAAYLPVAGLDVPSEFQPGWFTFVVNLGSSNVTITPGGTSTIDFVGSITIAPGQGFIILSYGGIYITTKTRLAAALMAIGALTPETGMFAYFTSPTEAALSALSVYSRGLLGLADAEAWCTALEIPSLTGYATESYVDSAVAALVNSSPAALDTLAELSAALGNEANFAAIVTAQIAAKLDASAVSAFMLSDILDAADLAALQTAIGVGTGANKIVQLDGTGKLPALDGSQLINLPVAAGIPVGTTIWINGTAAPAGYLKENGAEVLRADYSDLWAYAQASGRVVSEAAWSAGDWGAFSSGDGSTTFRIPDSRGEFVRGLDDGRGIDTGRLLGARQADELKSHGHTASTSVSTGTAWRGGGLNTLGNSGGANNVIDGASQSAVGASASTAVNNTGGTETRPRNVSKLACIKY